MLVLTRKNGESLTFTHIESGDVLVLTIELKAARLFRVVIKDDPRNFRVIRPEAKKKS